MDEPGALWLPSHNYFPGRAGHTTRYVIIHGTAGFGSAEEVGRYFQTVDVATHYTIGRDGCIVQSVREHDAAWGNGGVMAGHDPWWTREINPNYLTISIEHVKPHHDNSDELTALQQEVSFTLVRNICLRHQILMQPANEYGGITGHCSMDPITRSFCPGPYPWDELFAYLAQYSTTTTNELKTN
jgi:N-acetyl-anhydromuramyl-L-alanine amidase AmpD